MDSLKIKAEQIEFVTNVFHSLSDNRMNDENQGYENESSDVIIEQLDLVGNGLAGIHENGDIHENQENGDISSEPTLISEEQLSQSDSKSTIYNGKRKKTYPCEICGQIFLRSYQLNRHNFIGIHKVKTQNGSQVSQPNGNSVTTDESQWYNIQNVFHDMQTYYKCPFCNEASTDLKILDEHIQDHNGKTFSYICELCDKILPYPKYLKNHVISHTLNHFYKCDICERSFSSLPSLIKHEHSCHGKGMQTTCYQCKKVFENNNLWLSHSFSHTMTKPYTCDICSTGFIHLSILLKHKKCDENCVKSTTAPETCFPFD